MGNSPRKRGVTTVSRKENQGPVETCRKRKKKTTEGLVMDTSRVRDSSRGRGRGCRERENPPPLKKDLFGGKWKKTRTQGKNLLRKLYTIGEAA